MKRFALIILASFFVSACASQSGLSDLPDDEVATLHGSYWGSLRWHKAAISAYEKEDFGMRPVAMLELLPGSHTIWADCYSGFGAMSGVITVKRAISFNALAGHSYQVLCDRLKTGGITIWIRDRSSGEVVGGFAPE